MPPLSPYAATFAGRKIASGRLWLDLRYKIVKSELAGENKIVMQDFTLGERVEFPDALDLPVDLAVGSSPTARAGSTWRCRLPAISTTRSSATGT